MPSRFRRGSFALLFTFALAHLPIRATEAQSSSPPVSGPTAATELPLIAVLGDAGGTELTDFVVPRAILAESGLAHVVTVASGAASIRFFPGPLSANPNMTFAAFDSVHPRGATYVVVPALVDHESPVIAAWLRQQAARGATVVSICDGAWTVAHAGLFDGRRATGHWHSLTNLEKKYPKATWVRDRRYVIDDHLISTTGVSASLPASIYLIEQIAGTAAADSVARRVGLADWSPSHTTAEFAVSKSMYLRGVWNSLAWWRHDSVVVPVSDGVDEIALALTVDAIPRTMRGRPVVQVDGGSAVVGRQGLRLVVEHEAAGENGGNLSAKRIILPSASGPSAAALDSAIVRLTAWYGREAAKLIAMGMEFTPRR